MKFFLFFFSFLNILFLSFSQSVSNNMWVPDDAVNTILVDGDFTYIGGRFNYIGAENGSAVVYHLNINQPDTLFPKFSGWISAAVSDGHGGWYIGGDFSFVDTTRHYLVHINADGSIDPWNPNPDHSVYSLLLNGSDLYVGGNFTTIAETEKKYVAKFNITTGEIYNSWNVNINDPYFLYDGVRSMVIYQDSLFITGYFNQISNEWRQNIAKVSCSNGALSSWNPFPEFNNYFNVHSMCIKDSSLYIGGSFNKLNSHTIKNCARINLNTGLDTSWTPNPNNGVGSIVPTEHDLILGGNFDMVGDIALKYICKVNDSTGAVDLNWKPLIESTDLNDGIYSLCRSGNELYVAGLFTSAGGRDEYNICRLDLNSAHVDTTFHFTTNSSVQVLAISGNDLFMSGTFTSYGCERSSGVAKIDNRTGKAVPNWGRHDILLMGTSVEALTLAGDYLYVGGDFDARHDLKYLVRINSSTGELDTTWNMNVDDYVECLLNDGTDLYIGGFYSSIGGKSRHLLSRMNLSSGMIDDNWNPNVIDPGGNPYILTMDRSGDYIYIGGAFVKAGGQSRKCIAKISTITGLADPNWNPVIVSSPLMPVVVTIKAHGDYVYAGGSFYYISGLPRNGLAKININTGVVDQTWYPHSTDGVSSLEFMGDALVVGGSFDKIGNQTRHGIAKVDTVTASLLPWNPSIEGGVSSIKIAGNNIYVGGGFTSINGESHKYFAVLTDSVTAVKDLLTNTPSDYYLYQNYPNPFNPSTSIKFIIPESGKVVVKIYDILGTEITTLLNNILPAGEHSINFEGKNLSSGVYFYRIEAGSFIETKKMLLLK